MSDFENLLTKNIQADDPSIIPDPAIEDRLMYTMHIKSAKMNIRKNSIFEGIITNISPGYIGLKLAMISLVLIVFLGIPKFTNHSNSVLTYDTLQNDHETDDSIVFINDYQKDTIFDLNF